jgi:UDP-N-acetylglucosamine--N-acetylmuramyl-(pentapeptide) pyrophosphoryl-undecaprenol N-acetylglucosamine transferase
MRVVVSGGGTGGHIFPALALWEGLRRLDPSGDVLYIGGVSGMETEIVPKRGVAFQAVTARKLRKVVSLSTIGVLLSLVKGYQEAKTYLKAFRADAVVGTGGYVAAAAVLAGASLRLPAMILAPDAVPGRTNRLLARFVRRICVSFPQTISQFPPEKTLVTGLPLRAGIVAPCEVTQRAARCHFPDLSPDRFTILVIGGSQGARAINQVIVEMLPALLGRNMQILHQTGIQHLAEVETQSRQLDLPEIAGYCPVAFLEEEQVSRAHRAADVILCRGGISTLSENLANGTPAIIIPLPTAYADHQTANAKVLADSGAAWLLPEIEMGKESLSAQLKDLQDHSDLLHKMREVSLSLGRPNAADEVARLVLGLR